MTSASELFANRRSRFGSRNPNPSPIPPHPHLVLDEADSNFASSDLPRHHRRLRRRRHHDNVCDSPRSSHAGARRIFEAEHELLRSDNGNPNDSVGSRGNNSSNGETVSSRANRLTSPRSGQRNDQLPTDVLQARARLLERLNGISLMGDRQNMTSFRNLRDEFTVNNSPRPIYSDHWEFVTFREWVAASNRQYADVADDVVDQIIELPNLSWRKPPGLSFDKICSLPQEIFKVADRSSSMSSSLECCCICLERFSEGDRLSRLPCHHWFHPACLEPWLRICGDCPYCRASV